jgi:hypothetical protein
MKVAYNACYGGFSLSHAAIRRYAELKGLKLYAFTDKRLADGSLVPFDAPDRMKPISDAEAEKAFIVHYCTTPTYSNETYWSAYDLKEDRADPILIQVIEELGAAANGSCAKLKIDDVPKGTLWRIDEYDGLEHVATQDSYEWKVAT